MFKVIFTGRACGEAELEQESNLLTAANRGDVPLNHRCGGHARCGTCMISVEKGHECLSPAGIAETRILKILKGKEGQRLACQTWASGDVNCRVD
jgi:adenylate cyclase